MTTDFDMHIDDTLMAIEEAIDESGEDIDYDTISGILTLEFPDGSKIIINRQSATSQLWIAARSGGFHLDWVEDSEGWHCGTEQLDLLPLLNRLCSDQLGSTVVLELA